MKKLSLLLPCILFLISSSLAFARPAEVQYKGMAYANQTSLGKLGIYPTDIIIINNTPFGIRVSAPGIYKDYLGGNGVYRLTSYSAIAPEVILWNSAYGNFFDKFVRPHSIVSYSEQYDTAYTISVEYYWS